MAAERYEVNLTEWFNKNKKLTEVQPLAEVWNKGLNRPIYENQVIQEFNSNIFRLNFFIKAYNAKPSLETLYVIYREQLAIEKWLGAKNQLALLSMDRSLNGPRCSILKDECLDMLNEISRKGGASPKPLAEKSTSMDELIRYNRDVRAALAEVNKPCYDVLNKLEKCAFKPEDKQMTDYIQRQKELIKSAPSPEALTDLQQQLARTLAQVESAKFAIDKTTQALRGKIFSNGNPKAERIENAMRNVPIEKRGHILDPEPQYANDSDIRKVKEELASQRYFYHKQTVYKKGDEVDIEKAASSFKAFRTAFQKSLEKHSVGKEERQKLGAESEDELRPPSQRM